MQREEPPREELVPETGARQKVAPSVHTAHPHRRQSPPFPRPGARNALHASYAGLLPGSRVDAEGERPPGLGKLSPAPATDAERAGGGAYPRPRFPEGSARTGSLGSRLQTSRRCLPRRRDANARLVLGAVRPSAGPFLLRLRPPVSFSPPPPPPGRTL
uniref:Uncharacterized protein n=1 Tax=Rangifer tarandus platyrhynchus TaxID=3082113 RepID=A0ACB0EJU3_RANTA|nr:unnamed protein product [Rangifer tarandus platyrhynchus]